MTDKKKQAADDFSRAIHAIDHGLDVAVVFVNRAIAIALGIVGLVIVGLFIAVVTGVF